MERWRRRAPWAGLKIEVNDIRLHSLTTQRRWRLVQWTSPTPANLTSSDLVIAADFGSRVRSRLLRQGQSFADEFVLHLTDGRVMVHIELPIPKADADQEPVRATRNLPPSGVRVVQIMLREPTKLWTVRRLATEAVLSTGQAQAILKILETADLIETIGRGPVAARKLRDATRLLNWLELQPAAVRTPTFWPAYVYGRNGIEVMQRAVEALVDAEISYAVTGMAAAALDDLGPTQVADVQIWVNGALDLAEIASRSGLVHAGSGHNVALLSDGPLVRVPREEQVERFKVSDPPGAYLDLQRVSRGGDFAEIYRRVKLGY